MKDTLLKLLAQVLLALATPLATLAVKYVPAEHLKMLDTITTALDEAVDARIKAEEEKAKK